MKKTNVTGFLNETQCCSPTNYPIELDVELQDKSIFGDQKEYKYLAKCYDGYAICKSNEEGRNVPDVVYLQYPKIKQVLEDYDLCKTVLKYKNLYDLQFSDITIEDIAICLGRISMTLSIE